MAGQLPFIKMQGIGNDYIYINGFEQQIANPDELAVKISDRHFGVGGDGLVLLVPSVIADLRMRMFNSDGTEAEMCGNASRCVGKLAHDLGLVKKDLITLETGAGVRIVRLKYDGAQVCGATVDMGEPILQPDLIPVALELDDKKCVAQPITVAGDAYAFTAVSMGNPHAVIFMEGIDGLDLPRMGPDFENHEFFPKRVNTEFVEVVSRSKIRMRVWERGTGETLACGTGACAAVVACVLNGCTERDVLVELKGGNLRVNWDSASNHVYMTGPAVTVFSGVYYY